MMRARLALPTLLVLLPGLALAQDRLRSGPDAPALGAQRPDASEGFITDRDRIPPDIGERIRPGGSMTGR